MLPVGTLWRSGKQDTDEQPQDDAEAEATAAEGEVDEEAEALAGAGPDKEADEPPEAELLEDKANALDLGATTGEDAPPGEELELAPPPPEEERAGLPPLLARTEKLNMRVVGAVGIVILLLLTALAVMILGGPPELQIPPERYGDYALYDVTGDLELYSLEPVPVSLMGLELEINQLSLEWIGTVEAGVQEEATLFDDGYGTGHTVFQRYLKQDLNDVTGSYASEGSPPSQISSASLSSNQQQYVDEATLEIIREEIETYGQVDESATGLHWLRQEMVSWVPRSGEQGLLPHASLYVGRNLAAGESGSFVSQGVMFSWEVSEGGTIDGHETVKLSVTASKNSEITFIQHFQYQYSYRLDLWLSEQSAFPLRFSFDFNSDLKSPRNTLFSVELHYDGDLDQLSHGFHAVPSLSGGSISGPAPAGDFEPWVSGAPAFGNSSSSLDYSLQDAIQLARDQLPEVENYLRLHEDAFVTHAAYRPGAWNLTLAHQADSGKVTGWELAVNTTNASGEELQLDNPLLEPADLPQPLTLSSAEALLMAHPEIAAWATDADGLVDHAMVNLSLGQNLASRENLDSPLGILELGQLEQAVISSLLEGELDFSALTGQVDASGGYGYFIVQEQPQAQRTAAVQAEDGLVVFMLQQTNSG